MSQLDREREKLAWIEGLYEAQKKRVAMFEELARDPLDELFERMAVRSVEVDHRQSSAPAAAALDAAPTATTWPRAGIEPLVEQDARQTPSLPRKLNSTWLRILDFLGREGKSYAEVVELLRAESLAISPEAVRSGLMHYRKTYGLIDSPRRGFYRATDSALELIQRQLEGGDPAIGDSGISESQPTPVNPGGAA